MRFSQGFRTLHIWTMHPWMRLRRRLSPTGLFGDEPLDVTDPEPGYYRSDVPGFFTYEGSYHARRFSIGTFSLDAVLPVIDLHCYNRYYAAKPAVRALSHVQHLLGWWFVTNLIAAFAL